MDFSTPELQLKNIAMPQQQADGVPTEGSEAYTGNVLHAFCSSIDFWKMTDRTFNVMYVPSRATRRILTHGIKTDIAGRMISRHL